MKKPLLFLLFQFLLCSAIAQFVDSGQDPVGIKWKQINTPDFQLIFPDFFQNEAMKLAGILEKSYEYGHRSLQHKPRKISVILHNFTTDANANVLWAPKRSNFNVIPGQDIYPQKWLEQLALHEFRHVVQIDKMNQGITRILYFIFGEQATAAVFTAYIPFWMIEGDATITETLLSNTGRGRLPEFQMPFRTIVRTGRKYSYSKSYLGSYKDITPGYYSLGYFLDGYARMKYGDSIWAKILDRVAINPLNPTAFNTALGRNTGKGKNQLYNDTYRFLDSLWSTQEVKSDIWKTTIVNFRKNSVPLNYLLPQYCNQNQWIVLKQGPGQVAEFVKVDRAGREEHIFTPGFIETSKYSYASGKLAWTEYNPHVRWSNQLFSDLIVFDMKTGKRKMLTRRRYLVAPDISPDGRKLVAVETRPDYKFSLVFFDLESGTEEKRVSFPGNPFLLSPDWSSEGNFIVFIALSEKGKGLYKYHFKTGDVEEVLAPGPVQISLPVAAQDNIYFHAAYSGIDNIYKVGADSIIYKITASRYGSFAPAISPDGRNLCFMDFSVYGHNVAEVNLDSVNKIPHSEIRNNIVSLTREMAGRDTVEVEFDSVKTDYLLKNYSKFRNLINIHSWGPLNINASTYSVQPGFSVVSQNKLSTAFSSLGLIYDYNERTASMNGSFVYRGWFPVLSFTGSAGNRRMTNSKGERIVWQERKLSAGIQVPMNFTARKYQRGIRTNFSWNVTDVDQITSFRFREGTLYYMHSSVFLFRRHKTAERDLRSRWGQDFQAGLKYSPFGDFRNATQYFISGRIYLPVFYKYHHNLMISTAFQKNFEHNTYNFSAAVTIPRGYTGLSGEKIAVFSADYIFPVAYPDFAAARLVYIKRIYINIFWDTGIVEKNGITRNYHSGGIEVITDTHFFSHILPFETGVRYTRLLSNEKNSFQLIFRVGL
jgi:hypothetical protein